MSGSQSTPPSTTVNFEIEFYKATRAHEVALNNATATYEQSLLRLILILNAASMGGLLLWGSPRMTLIALSIRFTVTAIFIWGIRVFLAFVANWHGYTSQTGFTQAYLNRRRAVEMRFSDPTDPLWPENLGIEQIGPPDKVARHFSDNAFRFRKEAARSATKAKWFGLSAITVAFGGFIFAVAATMLP